MLGRLIGKVVAEVVKAPVEIVEETVAGAKDAAKKTGDLLYGKDK